MSSRPMQNALNQKIRELGRETYGTTQEGDYIDPDGELWVFEQIARGVRVGQIAASIDLGEPYGTPSRRLLYFWRDDGGETRKQLWAGAMKAAADEMMEISLQEAQDADETPGAVARVKHIHDVRKAIAAKQNPEDWGKKSLGEEIAGGIAALGPGLLAALEDYGHPDAPGMQRLQAADIPEAEVLEDGE